MISNSKWPPGTGGTPGTVHRLLHVMREAHTGIGVRSMRSTRSTLYIIEQYQKDKWNKTRNASGTLLFRPSKQGVWA